MIAPPISQEVGPFVSIHPNMSNLYVIKFGDDFVYLLDESFSPPTLTDFIPLSAIVYFFHHI